jgi:hypothetical protein
MVPVIYLSHSELVVEAASVAAKRDFTPTDLVRMYRTNK